jgi:Na+/proline symporter
MIENYYNYCHQVLGIHMYTIPLIIVAVLMIVMGLIHWLNQHKRQEEFDENAEEHRKDRMEAAAAAAAVSQTSTAGAKSADAAKS